MDGDGTVDVEGGEGVVHREADGEEDVVHVDVDGAEAGPSGVDDEEEKPMPDPPLVPVEEWEPSWFQRFSPCFSFKIRYFCR